jgi:hypothetical protein
MHGPEFSLCTIALGTQLLGASCTSAAEITTSPHDGCGISIDGEIAVGDAKKFISAFAAVDGSTYSSLCLNSSGGDLEETRKIIEFLMENQIGTQINDGAECTGACAYIFLVGRKSFYEGITTPSRHLHVGGKLKFSIPRAGPDAQAKNLSDAYKSGVRTVSSFVKMNVRFAGFMDPFLPFPKELLTSVLALEPDRDVAIIQVGDALKWQIDLFGVGDPKDLSQGNAFNFCAAKARVGYIMAKPVGISSKAKALQSKELISIGTDESKRIVLPYFGSNGKQLCVLDAYRSKSDKIYVDVSYGELETSERIKSPDLLAKLVRENDRTSSGEREGLPVWFRFPLDLKISDIPRN